MDNSDSVCLVSQLQQDEYFSAVEFGIYGASPIAQQWCEATVGLTRYSTLDNQNRISGTANCVIGLLFGTGRQE